MTLSENLKQPHPQANVRVDCLHELFEVQADLQADNLAIVYQSQAISYGEVEARFSKERLRQRINWRGGSRSRVSNVVRG